jgi:hypothetical protein
MNTAHAYPAGAIIIALIGFVFGLLAVLSAEHLFRPTRSKHGHKRNWEKIFIQVCGGAICLGSLYMGAIGAWVLITRVAARSGLGR